MLFGPNLKFLTYDFLHMNENSGLSWAGPSLHELTDSWALEKGGKQRENRCLFCT